jgi:hypothetical protein
MARKKKVKPEQTQEASQEALIEKELELKQSGKYKTTLNVYKQFIEQFDLPENIELFDFCWEQTKHLDDGLDSYCCLMLYNLVKNYQDEIEGYKSFKEDLDNYNKRLEELGYVLAKDKILMSFSSEANCSATPEQMFIVSKSLDLCLPF